ncbi:thrombopoietin isoform X2 [Tiliqua scincoides]|uniref:thrombopoietin isoform X2 n=1 Tax=Tiliqua scincoides TaxID=71010 RepID=UPI0034630827
MELNWLLLLTALLLHIQLTRMNPMGLICDRRLIQKYIADAMDMEEAVNQCEELPVLQQPVHLPLNQAKGQEVLHDLAKLVDGTVAAQQELQTGCAFVLLQQLYEKASSFLLQLRNLGWQEQDSGGLPERTSQLIPETNLRMIFQTYKQLVQGKLRFLFHDLGKDSCGGESRAANPVL